MLSEQHQVLLTDVKAMPTPLPFERSDLDHHAGTNELVRGVDAIVHSGPIGQIDIHTRCTYNILQAAVEEGVSRFIYLSSLAQVSRYDPGMAVTEQWSPVPSSDLTDLCFHLGEFVCREFAREGRITLVCLRLGKIVDGSEDLASGGDSALHIDDAVHAIARALTAEVTGFTGTQGRPGSVFHIQSPVPGARFLTTAAESILGYSPRYKG
jgi:nucleoside-diphosphate-sugar epimerase